MIQFVMIKWVTKKLRYGLLIAFVFLLTWTWFPWWQALQQPPSSIVVLGGGIRREMLAAHIAQYYSDLPIIISSGSSLPCLYRVFVVEKGVAWRRIKVDFRATDTLTNFTTLAPYLQFYRSCKVLMITSEGNLARASILAWLIWGSRGIAVEPVLVEGSGHNESWLKTLADSMRGLAWVIVGEKTVTKLYNSNAEIQQQMNFRYSQCEIGFGSLPDHI